MLLEKTLLETDATHSHESYKYIVCNSQRKETIVHTHKSCNKDAKIELFFWLNDREENNLECGEQFLSLC